MLEESTGRRTDVSTTVRTRCRHGWGHGRKFPRATRTSFLAAWHLGSISAISAWVRPRVCRIALGSSRGGLICMATGRWFNTITSSYTVCPFHLHRATGACRWYESKICNSFALVFPLSKIWQCQWLGYHIGGSRRRTWSRETSSSQHKIASHLQKGIPSSSLAVFILW